MFLTKCLGTFIIYRSYILSCFPSTVHLLSQRHRSLNNTKLQRTLYCITSLKQILLKRLHFTQKYITIRNVVFPKKGAGVSFSQGRLEGWECWGLAQPSKPTFRFSWSI